MKRPLIIWGIIAVVYGAFWAWYTPHGGPLNDEEIAEALAYVEGQRAERAPDTTDEEFEEGIAALRNFMEKDTGRDFVMVNAILMNETPIQTGAVEPGETSQQVLDRYMAYMWPALLKRASHPVFFGAAAGPSMEVLNIEDAEDWTNTGLMRYRSRRDMIAIALNPEFADSHEYKLAAMAKTFAYPVDPYMQFGGPKMTLGLMLFSLGALLHLAFGRGGAKVAPESEA